MRLLSWAVTVSVAPPDWVEMYAFYSLLVYIFYTVFKKEEEEEGAEEEACGAASKVCLATAC